MLKRLIPAAFVVALLPSSAAAQSVEQSIRNEVARLAPSPQPGAQSAERYQWEADLAKAQQRLRRTTWMMIGGAAFIGVGLATSAWEKDLGLKTITDYGVGRDTMCYVVGAGLIGYGVWDRGRAQQRIGELQAEGKRKGFALAITPARISGVFTYSF
jgi:hypothetical protein